jgi:hypothetical protein
VSRLEVFAIMWLVFAWVFLMAGLHSIWLPRLYLLIFHPTNKARLLVGLIEDRDGWRMEHGGHQHTSGLRTHGGLYFHMPNSEIIDLKWHEAWLVRRAWSARELDIKRQKQDEGLAALAQRVFDEYAPK